MLKARKTKWDPKTDKDEDVASTPKHVPNDNDRMEDLWSTAQ